MQSPWLERTLGHGKTIFNLPDLHSFWVKQNMETLTQYMET